jgi:type 1 glutamine amidotransferase
LKIKQIKTAVGFSSLTLVDTPDNLTFPDLDTVDIMICSYVSKIDTLVGKPFEKAFKQWINSGNRGWVGMHNTGANSEGEWPWFRDSVVAMRYRDHKDGAQNGTVRITVDTSLLKLPALEKLDRQFTVSDEWYSFDLPPLGLASPLWKNAKVLYYLDETTVKLTDKMGIHPVAWIREDAKRNRYFYTLLVHSDEGSASDFYHSLLLRGLEFSAGYRTETAHNLPKIKGVRDRAPTHSEGALMLSPSWWHELLRGRIF